MSSLRNFVCGIADYLRGACHPSQHRRVIPPMTILRSSRPATAAGIALAAVLLTTSCGSGVGTEVVNAGPVSVLRETEPSTGASGGVGVFGRLRLIGGRCVGFTFATEPTLIIFPDGTSVSGKGDQLVITVNGTPLHLGDRFTAGSRNSGSRPLSEFGDLSDQVPSVCKKYKALPVDGFVV